MEEEGLKDEEVIDVVIFSLGPGMKGCVFSIKLALVPEKRLAQWQEYESWHCFAAQLLMQRKKLMKYSGERGIPSHS